MRLLAILAICLTSIGYSQDRVFRVTEATYQCVDLSRPVAVQQPSQPIRRVVSSVLAPVKRLIVDPLTGVSVDRSSIVMITNGHCPHCDAWWAAHSDTLQSRGWNVSKVRGSFPGVRLYPTFRVYTGKRWTTVSGSMSMGQLREVIGEQAVTKPVTASRYSTDELRQMIHSMRPGGWRGPVYADVRPRSQAKQHLVGPEHGFSWDQVSGLTQDEALILHDLARGHGNKIFPTRG